MLEIEAEQLKASNERHLAIGAVDAVTIHILPPFLTGLSDQQPPIRLHLESSRYFQLFNRVASGHLDVAFTLTSADHIDLASTPIREYPMVIAYSGTKQLDDRVDLTDLNPSREIYLLWSSTFDLWRARRGLSRITTTVDKGHMLAPTLRNGAWAIVASFLAPSLQKVTGCTVHRIALDAPAPLKLYKITRKDDNSVQERQQRLVDEALETLRSVA